MSNNIKYQKVKCKLCGKVGVSGMPKVLRRHLRIAHSIFTRDWKKHFEEASPNLLVTLSGLSQKEYEKWRNSKWHLKRTEEQRIYHEPTARILYTPMGNKR